MTAVVARERVDLHWARFLGIAARELSRPGVLVTEHAALESYQGVWCFTRADRCVISAPAGWVETLRECVAGVDAMHVAASVEAALGGLAGLRVGPSYQGWLPPEHFTPVRSPEVCKLDRDGASALAALRSAVSPVEWESSGLASDRAETWGDFARGEIAALGQLRARGDRAVDPCVISHPRARGSGSGSRVVSAMCEEALSRGTLVLYQTLLANAPAVAIARRLGFEHYATLVAIRLRAPATPES